MEKCEDCICPKCELKMECIYCCDSEYYVNKGTFKKNCKPTKSEDCSIYTDWMSKIFSEKTISEKLGILKFVREKYELFDPESEGNIQGSD